VQEEDEEEEVVDEDSDWGFGEGEKENSRLEQASKHEAAPTSQPKPKRARNKAAALRAMAHKHSFKTSDDEDDDIFQSTPVKRRLQVQAPQSLLELAFLDEEVFDRDSDDGLNRKKPSAPAASVSDQYINRVLNQVRSQSSRTSRP
jgi:hypothetical protein